MGRKFKMQPTRTTKPAAEKLAKRKATTRKRAHRRGAIAELAWNAGARPADTLGRKYDNE